MSHDDDVRRRRFLRVGGATGVVGLTGLAGCTGGGGGEGENTETDSGGADDTDTESGETGGSGGPDALVVIGYPEDGTQLFRDYYSVSDGTEDIVIPDGLRDGALPAQVGNDMANVIGTAPAAGGPAQEAFVSQFEAEYDEAPGVFTSQSYDSVAVQLLANAAAGENGGEAIRDQMRRVANPGGLEVTPENFVEGVEAAANGDDVNYQGASSSVNFNGAGDPATAAYAIWEFDGTDSQSTTTLETQSFEGDTPEGEGPSADGGPGGLGREMDVGVLLPETGNLASVGQPMIQAARIPAKLVNGADVDLTVNAQIEDTETNPNAGTSAAERLVNAGIPSVCGTASSGVNVPVSQSVFIENGIVGCSPSSTALSVTNLDDDDYIFRTAPSDLLQGRVIAQVVSDRLGDGSVSTLYVNNDYGQQLSERVAGVFGDQFGGEVYRQVAFNQGESSYTSVVQDALAPQDG